MKKFFYILLLVSILLMFFGCRNIATSKKTKDIHNNKTPAENPSETSPETPETPVVEPKENPRNAFEENASLDFDTTKDEVLEISFETFENQSDSPVCILICHRLKDTFRILSIKEFTNVLQINKEELISYNNSDLTIVIYDGPASDLSVDCDYCSDIWNNRLGEMLVQLH